MYFGLSFTLHFHNFDKVGRVKYASQFPNRMTVLHACFAADVKKITSTLAHSESYRIILIKALAVHRGALFKGDRSIDRGGSSVDHGHDRHVHVHPKIYLGSFKTL